MARTVIRTASLLIDDINRIMALFGTIMNAHRRLGLEVLVPYQHFYRAMHFQAITPRHKQDIEEAWNRWKLLYLRPEVPESDELALSPYNRDQLPAWHADSPDDKELTSANS